MTVPFSYSTTYTLDKSHYSETYEASTPVDNSKKVYLLAILLALLGLAILLFTEINPYAAWFMIALGALEVFSLRFRKSWWLARQLISKAANTELTLTIDDEGVSSQSIHIESEILWSDITKIEKTAQGWLLYHAGGKNYLSNRCLSAPAIEFIHAKALLKSQ
ncbi:YcxB family protein [Paraglaciecola sp.]|uniref:YcxB family protein n=1 Tax=Paraglaciecola sp. TaxID=1920173 RepID=UPI0030F4A5F3